MWLPPRKSVNEGNRKWSDIWSPNGVAVLTQGRACAGENSGPGSDLLLWLDRWHCDRFLGAEVRQHCPMAHKWSSTHLQTALCTVLKTGKKNHCYVNTYKKVLVSCSYMVGIVGRTRHGVKRRGALMVVIIVLSWAQTALCMHRLRTVPSHILNHQQLWQTISSKCSQELWFDPPPPPLQFNERQQTCKRCSVSPSV